MDKRWKLDAAYLRLVCADSPTCVLRAEWVESCLCTGSQWQTPAEALRKSEIVMNSPLFTWSAGEVKADLKIAHGWLAKLVSKRPPAASSIQNDWLARVWNALPMFVYFLDGSSYFDVLPESWPVGREEHVKQGSSAVVALARHVLEKDTKTITSTDFELVGIYSYCLPPDLMKLCDASMATLEKASSEPVAALPPLAKGRSDAAASKGRKRKKPEQSDAGEQSLNALLGL
eukprot:6475611-Amphidinium_carterae.1